MNSTQTNRGDGAFTLIEMLCVIAIIGILAALLLPALSQGKRRAQQIQCVGNLKQIGVGFHVFAHDHSGKYPMQVPANEGGSEEFVQSGYRVGNEFYFSFRHFQPLASELGSIKLLVCPADLLRLPAASFAKLRNENLSYFVGVSAELGSVKSILAGDRNLTNDLGGNLTILHAGSGGLIRWTRELHSLKGNLLYSDGHVDELNGLRLAQNQTVSGDLFLPSVKASTAPHGYSGAGFQNSQEKETGATQLMNNSKGVTDQMSSGASARSPVAVNFIKPVTADSTEITNQAKPTTNRGVANSTPARPPPQDSGASPFMQWFADAAQQIVGAAKWLLWLLLLLLVIALVVLRLRDLSRRRNK